ncbi:MAG: N-acetyltransferase [Terracidiphilus sp.]|jgi:ribosomal-protein-alanine N-acetyltransferase
MLYRPYQATDFAQLYAIEEICFQPPLRFSHAHMLQLIQRPTTATWIAEENSQLTGFAIADLKASSEPPTAYIQTLEVSPDSRRRGIGAALLRHIESSACEAGAQAIWLHVDTENSSALSLYEAHGYTRQGREEHFYARHRPAFIYRKILNESGSS